MASLTEGLAWLNEHKEVLVAVLGVPAGLFALWRFLYQRDLEVRAPFRQKVLEQTFHIATAVGDYINAQNEASYDDAWQRIAVFYSGAGQLIGDEKLYKAFQTFGDLIWNLEYDAWYEDETDTIELAAYEFMRNMQRVLNRHWRARLSYVAPRAKHHKLRKAQEAAE